MKHSFSRGYKNWACRHNETLNITQIESQGHDLDDLLANCLIWVSDWHGNDGPDLSIDDLSEVDQQAIEQEFVEFLATNGPDEPDGLSLAKADAERRGSE